MRWLLSARGSPCNGTSGREMGREKEGGRAKEGVGERVGEWDDERRRGKIGWD